jgi:hypothetical protein
MDDLTDLAMWSLIAGFFLPPVLAIIMQSGWDQRIKAAVAFLACLAVGVGVSYFEGDLDGRSWVSSSLVVLVAAISTYQSFWKPTGIAPKIEAATNLGS